MSILTHAHDHHHVSLTDTVMNAVRSAFHAVVDWHRKRRAEAELMEMDDRMLADLGITRGEIHEKVWG